MCRVLKRSENGGTTLTAPFASELACFKALPAVLFGKLIKFLYLGHTPEFKEKQNERQVMNTASKFGLLEFVLSWKCR
jgi:hypothetical protein